MLLPALWLAVSLIAGATVGLAADVPPPVASVVLVAAVLGILLASRRRTSSTLIACALVAFASGGALLARHDREAALSSLLRSVLHAEFGGFALESIGPEAPHPPIQARAVLNEDAASMPPGAQMRVGIRALRLRGEWKAVDGGLIVSVSGAVHPDVLESWRAGRTIEAPMTFRRPARYFNPGVPDFERELALGGTTLFASVKSGLLVDVVARGSWRQERAAAVRAATRRAVTRSVAPHSAVSAAIVSAILIGDRTGLPDEVRERLQQAGVYHVLAISGGNIAIFVGAALLACRLIGIAGGIGTGLTLLLLMAYAQVVVAGPSVFRAVVMAAAYLVARMLDHRSPPWQAVAVAAALTIASDPLDVLDAGFLLTFAATAALLGAVRLLPLLQSLPGPVRWLVAAMLASCATELVLLPIGASQFGRVTFVGILANLVAIPFMTVTQIAGVCLALGAMSEAVGAAAGWVAHLGATALIQSARIADLMPWLATRVPPPGWLTVCTYYIAAASVVLVRRRFRLMPIALAVTAALMIITGRSLSLPKPVPEGLQITMFDVGQGEAIRVAWPGGESMLIDTGGAPFGGGSFDMGDRVLRPALWAAGVRHIDPLLVTHGDPDHIGGAAAVIESFTPRWLFEGVPVPGHKPFETIRNAAKRVGAGVRELYSGDAWTVGDVSVRVLSPDRPDWERRRVRNDDSVVLQVVHGDVEILLTGDIGADVEHLLVKNGVGSHLKRTPSVRILKVAHHGSKTSTSQALLDAWQPDIALISCGRGNRFGHPAPEVIERLERAGARIYRTDLNGAITLTSDGKNVDIKTMLP